MFDSASIWVVNARCVGTSELRQDQHWAQAFYQVRSATRRSCLFQGICRSSPLAGGDLSAGKSSHLYRASWMTIANSGWSGETGQGASSGPGAICRHKPFHNRKAWLATMAFHIFFLMLIVVNVVRTLRHPMWRDEMGTFQIATASASWWELLSKLQYTTHPGLWYSLVWLATRFMSDPTSMAIMHIVITIAVWTVIFRWSPFETVEKCLLLLSYFLFWEYFVISRNYALLALIGFAFVALQQHRPQQNVIPWLLLGLLANTHVLGAIWSIALGSTLVIKRGRLTPRFVTGAAIYLVLLAFSVKTAAPAPDFGPWATDVRFDTARFGQALLFPLGAFAPINPAWLADAVSFVAHAGAAPVPHFWNPNPSQDFIAATQADVQHPVRLTLALIAPLALCWMIVRRRSLPSDSRSSMLEFCCSRIFGIFPATLAITASFSWRLSPAFGRRGRNARLPDHRSLLSERFF